MYEYKNGLKCGVSKARVELYEALVPPICIAFLVVGFPFLMWYVYAESRPLETLLIGVLAGTMWAAVCALVGYLAFLGWCKPIPNPESSN